MVPMERKYSWHILYVPILTFLIVFYATAGIAASAPFSPKTPILPLQELRPGMKGTALTVVRGEEVVSFPVEIVSIVPQMESRPRHLIMVRVSGNVIEKTGGIAAGMSGSPVYINGKLIGAIGYGFNFSEHNIGYVTPIKDMESIWAWPEDPPSFPQPLSLKEDGKDAEKGVEEEEAENNEETAEENSVENENTEETTEGNAENTNLSSGSEKRALPLQVGGVSQRIANRVGERLGEKVFLAGGLNGNEQLVDYKGTFAPGEAIGVLLAWGDVTIGSIGTITSVDKDGRFLAFGHPFLGKGAVAFPAVKVKVHNVVPSLESPFKVGSFSHIVGTVTQDRAEAIGGRLGYFAPSIEASLRFKDIDRNERDMKRFHVVQDPFLGMDLASTLFTGLIDRLWGRVGEGTARISLQVEGKEIYKGWTRSNMYFSETDVADEALQEVRDLMKNIAMNPFMEISPMGIHLSVEITRQPKLIFIEGLKIDGEIFVPGQKVPVEVTLRPYRGKQSKKKLELTVPQDASGPVEIVVRGGNIMALEEDAIVQGWKTIDNFDQMLKEMSSLETNNEVIVELNYAKIPDSPEDMIPTKEDTELLSQVKERRLNEGTMRIFKTDSVVEGLLRKIIQVQPSDGQEVAVEKEEG
jgi:hypothetical protein